MLKPFELAEIEMYSNQIFSSMGCFLILVKMKSRIFQLFEDMKIKKVSNENHSKGQYS